MSLEFRIEFAPNGNDLRLTLQVNLPGVSQAGQPFDRLNLDLPPADTDRLRLGTAGKQLVDNVTAEVSEWLLSNDLGVYLNQAINQPNNGKVRLILSVNDEQLRSKLNDIPFELCTQSGAGMLPIVLREQVESVIYLLPKVGIPPQSTSSGEYPLRILLLRSNPLDLGGNVPPAADVKGEIDNLLSNHQFLSQNLVQIHILSSEPNANVVGRPTLEDLQNQLQQTPYDILVYLGHGEVLSVYPDSPPVGVLQLETADASNHESVPFDKLTFLLHKKPVPVVLLVGCLTAADIRAEIRTDVETAIPVWMRGSQAVAQALINSESGVQVAVGMRFRLETLDAKRFLKGFFQSLFDDGNSPGNVEVAVRSARSALKLGNTNYYSWSSPMVFSSLAREPIFSFLASSPPLNCPNVEKQQNLRSIFWNILSEAAWSSRINPPGIAEAVRVQLNNTEQELVNTILHQAVCLILPGFVEARHAQVIKIPINLHGRLKIEELRGRIVVGNEQMRVHSLEATQELLDSGYEILSSVKGNTGSFSINKASGNADLPKGTLFEVTVELAQTYPAVHTINLSVERVQPQKTVCVSSNVIVVPPP